MKSDTASRAARRRPMDAKRRTLLQSFVALGAVGLGTEPARADERIELLVAIDDQSPRRFTLNMLKAMPQQEAEIKLRSGSIQRWKGVPVTEILKACGLDLASNLGGGYVSRRVLAARAQDGYLAAFGLAEVDPRFGRQVPIVAWQDAEGADLPTHRGPLMLIVPEDARGSRGVRQLQSLEVMSLK